MENEDFKKAVRDGYGKAVKGSSCCDSGGSSVCCCGSQSSAKEASMSMGYSEEELESVPDESNLGFGCGNPLALAMIKEGDTVLDLGSGAGIDCFIASLKTGQSGRVIGIDMTAEMIEKARANAAKGNYINVEFRLGEIENLPVESSSVDLVISNCVINLVPDKKKAFSEAYRVLKPKGIITVSDIVLSKELPSQINNSIEAYTGCIAGACLLDDYIKYIEDAGFSGISIIEKNIFPIKFIFNDKNFSSSINSLNLSEEELSEIENSILSVKISAFKS